MAVDVAGPAQSEDAGQCGQHRIVLHHALAEQPVRDPHIGLERIADPKIREEIKRDILTGKLIWPHTGKNTWSLNLFKIMGWECVRIMSVVSEKNKPLEGMNLPRPARNVGKKFREITAVGACIHDHIALSQKCQEHALLQTPAPQGLQDSQIEMRMPRKSFSRSNSSRVPSCLMIKGVDRMALSYVLKR